MDVMDLVAKLSLDSSAYEKGLGDAEQKGKGFGGGVLKAAKGVGVAMAAVTGATIAVGGAMVKATGKVAEYGDHIDKMSQKMGISAEKYQEWDAILQHSGTSIDAMKPAMKTLVNAAQSGSDAFQELGLSQEQVASMSQEELFEATISGLQNMEDETKRTYLASKLLGRGGTELGALLNTSAEDTEAMRQKVHELGGVMSDEAVKAAAKYEDSLQDMTTAIDGAKRNILSSFMPSLTSAMDGISSLFSGDTEKGLGQIKEGTSQFIQTLMDSIPKVIEFASTMVSALGQAIIENLPMILEAGIQAIVQLANGISQGLPELIPKVVDTILTMNETMLDNIDLIVDAAIELMIGLAEGLIEALPIIIEKIPVIIEKLASALVRSVPKIAAAGVRLLSALVRNLPAIIKAIVAAVPKIVASLAGAFVKLVGQMATAGQQLMAGLGRGIVRGASNALNAAKEAAKSVLSVFTGIFAEHSPSMVMAKYGEYLDEGLAIGIERKMSVARNAMSKLANLMSEPVDEIGDMLDEGYDEDDTNDMITVNGDNDTGSERNMTVILQLDKMQLARAVYQLNNEETQRMGVSLSGGFA